MTQDSTRRPRLTNDERRRRLLEIGVELLGERSFWKLSAREVAERAGISVGLLYHYFSGIRPLYLASLKELASRLARATEWPPGVGLARGLQASLTAQVTFAASHSGAWRTLCGAGSPADPEVRAILRELRRVHVDRVLAGLAAGVPPAAARLRLE
ncbi:MAG: TetR/AcrR family transcriptional regulator, partial [Myxococcota bacterium]